MSSTTTTTQIASATTTAVGGTVIAADAAIGGQVLGISTLPNTGIDQFMHILPIAAISLGLATALSFIISRVVLRRMR